MPSSLLYKSTCPQLNFSGWEVKDNIITKMFLQSGWHKTNRKNERHLVVLKVSLSFFYIFPVLPTCLFSTCVCLCVCFKSFYSVDCFPGVCFISCHCSSLCIFSLRAFSCCLSVHDFVDLLFLSSLGFVLSLFC